MTSIKEILGFPDKCPVKQLQATVIEVYPSQQRAGKNTQDLVVKDGTGELHITAWEHSDLSFYKGKDVIISDGPKGGLAVNIYKGKAGLNMSRTCSFQLTTVQSSPAPVSASQVPVESATTAHVGKAPYINGQTIGMSINNVCQNLTARGEDLDPKVIWEKASRIVLLAQHMEAGHLHHPKKQNPANEPEQAPAAKPETDEPPF